MLQADRYADLTDWLPDRQELDEKVAAAEAAKKNKGK